MEEREVQARAWLLEFLNRFGQSEIRLGFALCRSDALLTFDVEE